MTLGAKLVNFGSQYFPETVKRGAIRARAYAPLSPFEIARSALFSRRHTGNWDKIIISRQVITEVGSEASIDVNDRFQMGVTNFGSTHRRIGRSKLEIESGGELICPSGLSRIGPSSVVYITNTGTFSMGNSYISADSRIICDDSITIGDGCAISWNIELLDSDMHDLWVNGDPRPRTAPITIGDDVWIGHDVTIKKGVSIGSGSVIASNSVVTHDVPEGVLVGGVPAETIHEDVRWS